MKILFVFAVLAVLGISAQTNDTNTTTTTTTTATPIPTSQPDNGTTLAPIIKPNTTTAAIQNITSTAAPVPTTPVPIGPRKSDNGTPADTGTWMVNRTDGWPCIIAEMAVKFVFNYNMTVDENTTKIEGIEYNLPTNPNMTTVSPKSICNNNLQVLVLNFFGGWEFSVYFNKTGGSGSTYEINSTSLYYIVNNNTFPNVVNSSVTTGNVSSDEVVFSWNDKSFLKCASNSEITGFNMDNGVMAWLNSVSTKEVRLDAFRTDNSTEITASPSYCAADTKVSNIVPIAVGAALAGLVLIVLIAYLIGRSRNQRGYESV